MSRTPRVDAFIAAKDIFCDSDELFDFLNFAADLEQMLDAALASNKQLAEANRKLAERINDDQRYLVAPLCNAEKALDDCQEELAEARAEIEENSKLLERMKNCQNCGRTGGFCRHCRYAPDKRGWDDNWKEPI